MTPAEIQKREMIRAMLMGGEAPAMPPVASQGFRPNALGADRSFAPGPGVKVAQNETANDAAPSAEELAALAQGAGFDPNDLIGLDLNATESKNLGLTLRMMQAESTLRPMQELGTRFKERALEWLPGETLENMAYANGFLGTSPEYQQYKNARNSFANAALRADTGATINESELPEIIRESMPLPGDTEETLAQKQRTREARIRALIAGTGAAAGMLPQPGQPIIAPREMSDEDFLKSLGIE